MAENSSLSKLLSHDVDITEAQVIWAVRHEMARTVEDVLARRTRILFINAQVALDLAPKVAEIMKTELGQDDEWETDQVNSFVALAQNYSLQHIPVDYAINKSEAAGK